MKKLDIAAFSLLIVLSFLPQNSSWKNTISLENGFHLNRFAAFHSFDLQRRKAKKDSDELIRSDENFDVRTQGIIPLWACAYSRGDHDVEHPIIRSTDDGGFIVGCTYEYDLSPGIAKLSSSGDLEWQRSYELGFWFRIFSVEQTSDSGYILTGEGDVGGIGNKFIVIKIFPDGSMEWKYAYGGSNGESAHSIRQTSDGGYIIVGVTTSFTIPEYVDQDWGFDVDLLVIKLSADGSIEWQRAMGGPGFESDWLYEKRVATILESSHGGYIVVCDTPSFSDNQWSDIWVVKLSDLGDIEWQRVYGGKESEWLLNPGPHAIETTDGKYIIASYTLSFGVVDPGADSRYSDVWVLKLQPDGDIEWQKTYGGINSETVQAIHPTDNGGCVVVGASNSWSESNNPDFWVFRLSSSGNIIWQHTYGGSFWDEASSVCFTSDCGIGIAGTTSSFADNRIDLLILKVTSNGTINSVCSDLVKDSDAAVMDTDVAPFDTYEVARLAAAAKIKPNITTKVMNIEKNMVCWNLNQPPLNPFFERVENKSYFVVESWHTITWSLNPYNAANNFNIVEYVIYRKNVTDGFNYSEIARVTGNIYIFIDTNVSSEKQYLYAVASVDSEGNESPRSEAVGNLD